MCSNQDCSSIDLDSLLFKLKNKMNLSEFTFLSPDFLNIKDVNINPIPFSDISIYNTHTGVIRSLTDYKLIYTLDKNIIRASYLFIKYTSDDVIEAYNFGCIRCSVRNGSICNITKIDDGFGVDIRSDILSICRSPLIVEYRFILPKNKLLSDNTLMCTSEGYGDNINLFMFFSRNPEDTTNKYTLIEYRADENSPWCILSLKSRNDYLHFINDKTDNELLKALYKRLKLLYERTDFNYLGYK